MSVKCATRVSGWRRDPNVFKCHKYLALVHLCHSRCVGGSTLVPGRPVTPHWKPNMQMKMHTSIIAIIITNQDNCVFYKYFVSCSLFPSVVNHVKIARFVRYVVRGMKWSPGLLSKAKHCEGQTQSRAGIIWWRMDTLTQSLDVTRTSHETDTSLRDKRVLFCLRVVTWLFCRVFFTGSVSGNLCRCRVTWIVSVFN